MQNNPKKKAALLGGFFLFRYVVFPGFHFFCNVQGAEDAVFFITGVTGFCQEHHPDFRIGHFHLAGYPGRHEPLTLDEIDTAGILRAIARSNYQGLVGLEYLPASDADESLRMTRKKLEEIFEK